MVLVSLTMTAATFSTFDSRTDFRDESIYFIITTRFFDGDSLNNVQCWDNQSANEGDPAWRGDFKGLIEKMDYIKALGFTAIWMTPIVTNASGYDYHGYHAMDFSEVDHRYLSEGVGFEQVVKAAHERGMKIILDIVLNHTGNFGERNLCPLFERDWKADQSDLDACLKPITQAHGGLLPDNYESLQSGQQYAARLSKMKNSSDEKGQKNNYDSHNYWHHYANFNWDNATRWWAQIAGDCVDLNTENPAVYNYLINCYKKFIEMGVDGFRIDTGGHIARLTFNNAFNPAFIQAGKDNTAARGAAGTPFYMFAEVCARAREVTYRNQTDMSPYYYTWAESKSYAWDTDPTSFDKIVAWEGDGCDTHTNHKSCWQQDTDDNHDVNSSTPKSNNALLQNNTYHQPDYSKSSGLNVIDFPVHWNYGEAKNAWNTSSPENDKLYNDATWNVVYVDSHDYAPDEVQQNRFEKGQDVWAENLSLMFTNRGIPCLYYGSEVEFKKGKRIDPGPNGPLSETGRAYFGGYIKGDVSPTGFGEYSSATGNLKASLEHPLARHIRRLNRIRQAVPALRKGQLSRENCSGSFAFKRRYTDDNTDSFVLICISGNGTFTNLPAGTYVDCITGDSRTISQGGTLNATCSGKGNMRVYVLNTILTPAPGKIGNDGKYLYTSSSKNEEQSAYDGTQEEKTTGGGGEDQPVREMCLTSEDEKAVFFTKPTSWGKNINCYIWIKDQGNKQVCGGWPGKKAENLGEGNYKFVIPDDAPAFDSSWMIIWNDGSNQTNDMTFTNHGLWSGSDRNNISLKGTITNICETSGWQMPEKKNHATKFLYQGRIFLRVGDRVYSIL